MGIGAALSGGAQGLMGGWEDNREAIRAQADQDFKLSLEQERAKIQKQYADQTASDLLDPESPQGALAARNSQAEADARQAERDREDKQAALDRASREKTAALKDGKGDKIPAKVKLAYDMSKAIGEMEVPTEADLKQKAFYDKIIADHLGGMSTPKGRQDLVADVAQNLGNKDAMAQLDAKFGKPQADLLRQEASKTLPKPPPVPEEVDTSASGMVSSHLKEQRSSQATKAKEAKASKIKAEATSSARDYMEQVKSGTTINKRSYLPKGAGGFMEESSDEKLNKLADIADNPDVDPEVRQEARAMIEKAIRLKQGEKVEAR